MRRCWWMGRHRRPSRRRSITCWPTRTSGGSSGAAPAAAPRPISPTSGDAKTCGESSMRSTALPDAHRYWSDLVVGGDPAQVEQVGHPDMGGAFNRIAYELRLRAVDAALRQADGDPPASV